MNDDFVLIEYVNDVYCRVISKELSVLREISDNYTFEVPGAKFSPAFRSRHWDGKIRLFNLKSNTLYLGLLPNLIAFLDSKGYKYTLANNFKKIPSSIDKSKIEEFLTSLNIHSKGIPLTPLPHQIEGVWRALNRSRCLLLSPTGSGKSYIIYALIRKILETAKRKVLIVVPSISLVSQMYNDFIDYSSANGWSVEDNVHTICEGTLRYSDKSLFISTWQSIYKMPAEYFEQFEAVIIDESHFLKNDAITKIMKNLVDCPFRVGFTGTLDGMKTNKLVIEGLTGKTYKLVTTSELMKADILSTLHIDCINLKYSQEERKKCKELSYQEEISFLIENEKRNKFITDLALSTKSNTLILYQFVEKHGKVLYDLLKKNCKDSSRPIYYMSGKTESEIRESVRQASESHQNAILICSYGIFSTGINIKNLHNIIFASPSKGRIRVLQSIGRQLRKHESKEIAKLYDISDDLSINNHKNYSLKHLFERIKIYNEEKFDYKLVPINLSE